MKESNSQFINAKEIREQYMQDKNLTIKERIDDLRFVNFKIDKERISLQRQIIAVIDFDLPKYSQTTKNSIYIANNNSEEIIQTIPDSKDKWWIDVPICNDNNKIIWIQMLADPGANIGCVNTKFAIDNFPDSIVQNNKRGVIATPNGHILPKYALWLKFPTKKGYIYAARFLLLNDLPAPILADINMLRAWGYEFNDGIPPVFVHKGQDVPNQMHDLDAKMETKYKINKPIIKYTECRNLDSNTHIAATIFDKYKNAKLANFSNVYKIPPIATVNAVNENFAPQIDTLFSTDAFDSIPNAICMLNTVNLASIDAAANVTQNALKSHFKLSNSVQLEMDNVLHQVKLANIQLDDALSQINIMNAQFNRCAATATIGDSADLLLNNPQEPDLSPLIIQSQTDEECEPDPDDIDPWRQYDLWKERLDKVDKIGGDLNLRNHNLCLLVNNQDPILPVKEPNQAAESKPKAKQTNVTHQQFRGSGRSTNKPSTRGTAKNVSTTQNQKCNKKATNQVNFITSPNHILATPDEIEEAKKLHKNAELKFNNLKHLFKYERDSPTKYKNLYNETKKIMNRYKYRVFALHTYDRKTMKLKAAVRLGLKDEYRNVTHYLEQYPLNREKKLAMINETIELDKNGFWIPIEMSKNNIPYTVIAKKPDAEGHVRHRAAFDARSINKFCELIQAKMPTMRNFDDFYARPGLVTLADFKNFFDCIPLHEDDWQFAVVQTPLGLRMMTHCSYG